MNHNLNSCTTLNNGLKMPWLGYGVYQVEEGQEVEKSVNNALQIGYRSIDTAAVYGNEIGVGKAIKESGIPREQIFLTTKVWNDDQRKNRTLEAFQESLSRLGTHYVDLYLIHWPVAGCYEKTWKVMEEIYKSGRAKAIGVSNFLIPNLQDILKNGTIVPAVNQIEYHPYLVQPELVKFCKDLDIQVEAWSPLMQGHIVSVPEVQKIAEKYNKSAVQIALRWNLQHQVITIPKSITPERILENTQVFDFKLSQTEMDLLDSLDRGKRFGPDPDNFNF